MSKKFRDKTCVYCGKEKSSQTGDHVFAREFFLKHKRNNLPQVPACEKCNNEKSKLEHYLTTILPFGAHHADAGINLATMVPKRLAANAKLHRKLAQETEKILINERGVLFTQMTVPIDGAQIEKLFSYIIKGLMWHHWRFIFTSEHFVTAGTVAKAGEQLFERLFSMNAERVSVNLGEGTFQYEGARSIDNPYVSVWKIKVYGGLRLSGDPKFPNESPAIIWGTSSRDTKIVRDAFMREE